MPVQYGANKKVLDYQLVSSWVATLGSRTLTGKKILLFVGKCLAHVLQNLEKSTMVFLPAKSTSAFQPMGQGEVRSLKCHFPTNTTEDEWVHWEEEPIHHQNHCSTASILFWSSGLLKFHPSSKCEHYQFHLISCIFLMKTAIVATSSLCSIRSFL